MNTTLHIPTISSSTMLVELYLSGWSARKMDRKASNEVAANNNAERGVARVHKDLLGKCEELSAIQKFDAGLRVLHYKYTLPWSDTSGSRLLSTKAFDSYTKLMSTVLAERDNLVDKFIRVYSWKMADARIALGNLFDSSEYPDEITVRSKFGHSLKYLPIPDSGNWLLDMDTERSRMLQEQCMKTIEERVHTAMADVWGRLHDSLAHMSERLDYVGDTDKKTFRDSLVDNVVEVIDVLKLCNVTNDPQLDEMRERLEHTMTRVTPEGLRTNHGLRIQTKREVDEIIAGIPSLMG